MSRIGRQPVVVPSGVEVTIADGNEVSVKGPKGSLKTMFRPEMKIFRDDGAVKVERSSDEPFHRSLHGLTRNLLANMVTGVTEGFERTLELVGVGYRAQASGKGVTLSVMFSHTVDMQPPDGVTVEIEGNNRIHVRGIDKQQVGEFAARIRAVRPPNPYTGKGVRYAGEQVKLKAGKAGRRL